MCYTNTYLKTTCSYVGTYREISNLMSKKGTKQQEISKTQNYKDTPAVAEM